jgi:hypothetical protein
MVIDGRCCLIAEVAPLANDMEALLICIHCQYDFADVESGQCYGHELCFLRCAANISNVRTARHSPSYPFGLPGIHTQANILNERGQISPFFWAPPPRKEKEKK